jgi:transposase
VDHLPCPGCASASAEEIALHTGVSATTVHRVIATYNRLGPAAVETPGKGGRRHQYLTWEEEEQFLAPFFAQAKTGEIATVAQIQHTFEERLGHEVDDSTIYRLLNRHGWRKLMPRPKHPNADPQAQEQFQQNFSVQVEADVATREDGEVDLNGERSFPANVGRCSVKRGSRHL